MRRLGKEPSKMLLRKGMRKGIKKDCKKDARKENRKLPILCCRRGWSLL